MLCSEHGGNIVEVDEENSAHLHCHLGYAGCPTPKEMMAHQD